MAAVPQSFLHSNDVGGAAAFIGEKMERGAVVPNVVDVSWLPDRRIRDDPVDGLGCRAEAGFRDVERRLRQIENRKCAKPLGEPTISTKREAPPPISMIIEADVAPMDAISSREGPGFT